jgi:phosphopentomutase
MRRVLLIVMDGCGVGAMPDAAAYGAADPVSATLPHVAAAVGGLHLPTLQRLGLGNIAPILGVAPSPNAIGGWGRLAEASAGKDSVTGHWEMMGITTKTPFPTYPHGFPPALIAEFEDKIGRGTLGNIASSGTAILTQLGQEHIAMGKPIVYTSADSVFQVAAHERIVPLEELYAICETARALLTAPNNVQRVIARPFLGDAPNFQRTENRRDYPLPPPEPNFLTTLADAGKTTYAIGVVADLFPRACFARAERTQSNAASFAAILEAVQNGSDDFLFANCEDFDMLYGHRNDPVGFARALEAFDAALATLLDALRPDDLLLLTADHGNDPTTVSTDHSREYVPLLVYGIGFRGDLETLPAFAALSQIASDWLGLTGRTGRSKVNPSLSLL